MKVTIRGVSPKLWEQAKHDCITDDKTLGQIVNEGLVARTQLKMGMGVEALQEFYRDRAEARKGKA